MGQIKLYKKFYCVDIIRTGATLEQNYILLDPYSLSVNTYIAGTGATESNFLIEQNPIISKESTGIYFTDLNPNFYSSDVTYDLIWFIKYTSLSPIKKLSTRFRLNINSVSNQLEIEITNSLLEIEILGKY